jgi:hypothetical protein
VDEKIPARNPPRLRNHLVHDEPMALEPVSISEAALDLPAAF